jgi:Domain of unknown function (DUF5925)/ATPase family associated with various cellular activities (AAA)
MPFTAAHHVEHDQLASAVFNARVIEAGLPFMRSDNWATRANAIGLPGDRLFVHAARWGRREVIRANGVLADVGLYAGQANIGVAAASEEEANAALEQLRALLPAPDPSGAQEVTVTFWTYGPHGPQPAWRTISVPAWGEISDNYSGSTSAGLNRLMEGFQPAHGGQLVLWHGTVGTGKTFALRALAWEWRDWCDIHYIVDPDSFFGQHADYLMHVLLQSEWEDQMTSWASSGAMTFQMLGVSEPEVRTADTPEEPARRKGWRLLVLEDTGELLQPDAKAIIGQGLSRFLNVADGLIGQGLRVLVLVTTNEEIRKLHPAVARPGRSAANVRFDPLTTDEASAWLARHGLDRDAPESPSTIAELYARLEGLDTPKPSVGFDEP